MQNRNNTIEERLQIINDYIQRTMDALNATRQVVQGLSSSTQSFQQNFVPVTPGISHSSFVAAPQFVQTPYGLVAVNQVSNLSPFNYGASFGLHHSAMAPQLQTWPVNYGQIGYPQLGLNYGWNNGLSHTQFVPQTYGWNTGLGHAQFGHAQFVPQTYGWNTGLSHTQFVPQTIAQWPLQQQWSPIQGTQASWGLNQVAPQAIQGQTIQGQTF
jgi:hypothetical protein